MIRIVVAALFALHGVIHFLGFAEAFGVTDLPQFDASIPPAIGLLWLVGGLLCLATAAALFLTPQVVVGLRRGCRGHLTGRHCHVMG